VTGTKTNERPGTRAVLRHSRMSAYKAREVLDLIRGKDYERANEILEYSERGASTVIRKLLQSAAANAVHNDGLAAEELFVSACYADEGTTLKRWRPRARGRATRVRKRTCHITVIVSRLPDNEIVRRRARIAAEQAERRARRVAGGRRRARAGAGAPEEERAVAARAPRAGAEALAALEEARAIEETTQHAELEAEAESALDLGEGPGGAGEDADGGAASAPDGETSAGADDSAANAPGGGASSPGEVEARESDTSDASTGADDEAPGVDADGGADAAGASDETTLSSGSADDPDAQERPQEGEEKDDEEN
jgi:large subunit ribosomal protein L22